MKTVFVLFTLVVTTTYSQLTAQEAPLFPVGEKAANVHHVGTVYLNELVHPDSVFNFSISFVVSEAGSRLNWHSHPGGQILMVTDGIGYYQERGKTRQTIRKGDIIQCQPGVAHWHGATPESGVTYIATSPAQNGKTIWFEPVDPELYNQKNK